jgi:hypothetical protein
MPIKKPAPDAIKKRDHAQSVPACSPRSKVILALDNQHGIYREQPIFGVLPRGLLADQSLALRKSQNAGSNRRSWAKACRQLLQRHTLRMRLMADHSASTVRLDSARAQFAENAAPALLDADLLLTLT